MELVKEVRSWGNSAGVLLPKEWGGKEVKVILIDRTLQIKKEIFSILENYLDNILGIYLVGSYARGEEEKRSDIDVLVITSDMDKKIKLGKYNMILISKENVEGALKDNVLPLLPMLKEAKSIINSSLLEDYSKTILTKRNLKFHIETTKSAMKINKRAMELEKDNCSDATAYSLILRLREVYIVRCLIENKKYSNKEFLKIIKKISSSLKAYKGYLRVKDEEKGKGGLPLAEAQRLYDYINKKIREQEKWLAKRK